MSLHQDIKKQMVEAMKVKDTVKLNVLRGLMAVFTNEAITKRMKPDQEFSDEEVQTIISRAVKQRKDSIEQFEKAGRKELADNERAELAILESYLPKQMSREEVATFVKEVLAKNPLDPSKKGPFVGTIMKELKGRADGNMVKEVVDELTA